MSRFFRQVWLNLVPARCGAKIVSSFLLFWYLLVVVAETNNAETEDNDPRARKGGSIEEVRGSEEEQENEAEGLSVKTQSNAMENEDDGVREYDQYEVVNKKFKSGTSCADEDEQAVKVQDEEVVRRMVGADEEEQGVGSADDEDVLGVEMEEEEEEVAEGDEKPLRISQFTCIPFARFILSAVQAWTS